MVVASDVLLVMRRFRSEAGLICRIATLRRRDRYCLRRALESCDQAATVQAQGLSPEYTAIHFNEALRAVGEVIGVVDVEQILDSVFSQFCIGK